MNSVSTRPVRISRKIRPPVTTVPAITDWCWEMNFSDLVGELLEPGAVQVERRAGQGPLNLVRGPLHLGDEGRVVGADPVGGQRHRAGDQDDRHQQGEPGRGEGGHAGPAQPRRQRLQQRGEQQRGDERQHDKAQLHGHPEGAVDEDGDQDEPPRPGGGLAQDPRHLLIGRDQHDRGGDAGGGRARRLVAGVLRGRGAGRPQPEADPAQPPGGTGRASAGPRGRRAGRGCRRSSPAAAVADVRPASCSAVGWSVMGSM